MQLYLLYLPTYMYVYNNCGVVLTSNRFKMSLIRNIEILLLHYKVCNSGIIKMK